MDLNTINEAMMANPVSFFVMGIVVGFFLRGLIGSVFTASRSKKPSRYRTRKANENASRTDAVVDIKEPALDWSESAVRKIAQQSNRYTNELNQVAKNLQQVAE